MNHPAYHSHKSAAPKSMPRITKLLLLAVVSSYALDTATASDWAGGSANWSSNLNPGWNGNGVPNAAAAIANFSDTVTGTTTQDVSGGVTVVTISFTANSSISRAITNTNGITLNQDGAGAGFATISNANPFAGSPNLLSISGGTLTLADDLLVSNTSGSTFSQGAIQISSVIAGTGNITLNSNSNTVSSSGSFPGAIRFLNATNTFTGSVLVQKGATTFNSAAAFGNSANVITLGQSGQGSASLVSTTSVTVANPIVVAAGSGGTLLLGGFSNPASGYSGAITMNGNLTYDSRSTAALGSSLTGAISGAGSLTKIGSGVMSLTNTANSYQGGTFIGAGSLVVTADHALGAGNVSLTAGGVTLTLSGGLLNDYIADSAALSMVTGSTLALNFTGTDIVQSYLVNGVAQAPGIYSSANEPGLITGTGTITVVPEPSTSVLLGLGALLCAQQLRRRKSL